MACKLSYPYHDDVAASAAADSIDLESSENVLERARNLRAEQELEAMIALDRAMQQSMAELAIRRQEEDKYDAQEHWHITALMIIMFLFGIVSGFLLGLELGGIDVGTFTP